MDSSSSRKVLPLIVVIRDGFLRLCGQQIVFIEDERLSSQVVSASVLAILVKRLVGQSLISGPWRADADLRFWQSRS